MGRSLSSPNVSLLDRNRFSRYRCCSGRLREPLLHGRQAGLAKVGGFLDCLTRNREFHPPNVDGLHSDADDVPHESGRTLLDVLANTTQPLDDE